VDVERPMLVKIYGTGRPVSIMPKWPSQNVKKQKAKGCLVS
jgi:hypothetical protein